MWCCSASLALASLLFKPRNAAVLQQLLHCSYCPSSGESPVTLKMLFGLPSVSFGGWNNKDVCISSGIFAADNGFEMRYLLSYYSAAASEREGGNRIKICLGSSTGCAVFSLSKKCKIIAWNSWWLNSLWKFILLEKHFVMSRSTGK